MERSRRFAFLALVLLIAASSSAAPIFRLDFEGPTGDYISQGQHVVLTEQDVGLGFTSWDLTSDGEVDRLWFTSAGVGDLYFLLFFDTNEIPGNLTPGFYGDAQRSPFADPGHPGFWLAYDHRGCNRISGSFSILDAVFGPSGPKSFSATFEQSCEGNSPPLTGSFFYSDSSAPTPTPAPSTALLVGTWLVLALRRRSTR